MCRRVFDVARDCAGAVLVEFTIVLPVLLLVVLGIAQFGLVFYDYIMVTNAAATGARQLSISVYDTNAYTDTVNAIIGSTSLKPALSSSNITLSVNGTSCTTNGTASTSCYSLLQAAFNAGASPPQPVNVTVQYSCSILIPVSWVNLTGICPLKSTMQQPVE